MVQLWATGWMIRGSSPGQGWKFLSSPPRPDRLYGPPSLLSNVYQGLSLGVRRPGREADHSPPSSAGVKNVWSYTSTPLICLHGRRRTGTLLPLQFTFHLWEYSVRVFH
jgi:hypothetical protein